MNRNPIEQSQGPLSEFVVPVPTGTSSKPPYTFSHAVWQSRSEYMSDDNHLSVRRRWKSCDHVKVVTDYPRNTISYHTTSNHGTNSPRWLWVTTIPSDSGLLLGTSPDWADRPDIYEQVGDRLLVKPIPELADLVNTGFKSMLPGIRPQLSLLNTIAEMRDFKSLGRSVDKLRYADVSLYNRLFKLTRNTRTLKQIVRSMGKAGSDSYLQMQFNILPLIRDLRSIYDASRLADQQVARLLDQEGKLQVKRFARPLTNSFVALDETTDSDQGISSLVGRYRKFRRVTAYDSIPMFRMQMAYSYKLRDYQRLNSTLLGRLDSMGAGGFRPSVIWNGIRWSFVVDWFLGIGRWLKDNADEGALDPVTVIHGHLWSTSVRRLTTYQINLTVASPYIGSSMVTYATTDEEAYQRSTQGLDVVSSLKTSGMNLKEFTLASALLISSKA